MAYRITEEAYNRMFGSELEARKKAAQAARAGGTLMKKSDLAGVIGWGAAEPGETYVPTESEYQKNNPNSAEFKAEEEKRKQERFDRENKEKERMNRLKATKPWLFGYGAGAYVQ